MGDLGKLIVAKGFKKLPKVQKIAQSGHTGHVFDCKLVRGNKGLLRMVLITAKNHVMLEIRTRYLGLHDEPR